MGLIIAKCIWCQYSPRKVWQLMFWKNTKSNWFDCSKTFLYGVWTYFLPILSQIKPLLLILWPKMGLIIAKCILCEYSPSKVWELIFWKHAISNWFRCCTTFLYSVWTYLLPILSHFKVIFLILWPKIRIIIAKCIWCEYSHRKVWQLIFWKHTMSNWFSCCKTFLYSV